ncbi:DUF7742 family protein [Pseudoroseicyclus sp. H15]
MGLGHSGGDQPRLLRPITLTDLDSAARALLTCPPGEQPALAAQMLHEADIADRYRKRLHRPHTLGSGTLAEAALRRPRAPGPSLDSRAYLEALSTLLTAIATWRSHRQR